MCLNGSVQELSKSFHSHENHMKLQTCFELNVQPKSSLLLAIWMMFQGVFLWIEPSSCSKSFNLQVGYGWFAFGPAASMVDRPQRNSWEGLTITPVDEASICLFFCIWDACRLGLDFSINLHGHTNHAFHVAAWKCKNGMIRHRFQCFRAKP
jgi:hypothetical protein